MTNSEVPYTFSADTIVSSIQKHFKLTIFIFLCAIAASVVVAMLSHPFYKTTTKLLYQSPTKSNGGLSALASLAGMSIGSSEGDISACLADILLSKDMSDRVLEKTWRVSEVFQDTVTPVSLEKIWKIEVDTTKPQWEARKRQALLMRLIEDKYIEFLQDKKSGIISITTEFEDPRVSYDVNVFLVAELNDFLVTKMNRKAEANRKFIEERLGEVKVDLRNAEIDLRTFRERNVARMDPGVQLEDLRLQRSVTISQELMLQLRKQFELAKIEEARDLPVLDEIDSARFPLDKSKPKRKLIVVLGAFLGFFASIAGVVLWDALIFYLKYRKATTKV